ncbi:MAG: acetate--CoA ligase [Flavobacteriia bacterium]|nr:acetate--CoA ligase [Flavobacteriia bacterium]
MKAIQINSFEEYQEKYTKSITQPEAFWGEIAFNFRWKKKWDTILNWDFQDFQVDWFKGGKLNITETILEENIVKNPDKVAYYWEKKKKKDQHKSITYLELYYQVCELANGLKSLNVQKGDRVCIYMPMVIESVVAMLACARIGAVHSVVFAGFSANALADRINDAAVKVVLTADGLNRGDKKVDLKSMVDEALVSCSTVENVIVLDCIHSNPKMKNGRDIFYHDLIAGKEKKCDAAIMDAEDMLFILYTSGSTGKPKGVVHTCGGYMVYTAYTFQNAFQYDSKDVFWCTADIGWITGHSYIVYGSLLCGATSVLFEGIPTFPDAGRFWEIIEKYKVNQFYTAPTAIRSLMSFDLSFVEKHDLSSLKIIGSVGEPINEEAWNWYYKHVGKNNCPIIDTWWQTETGGIMLSGLGGLSPMKATFAGYPIPGIQLELLDTEGNKIQEANAEGYLCVKFPWPSMIRTTYGDHERCQQTYFSNYKGYYFTGDGAKRDEHGMYRIIGRVDDVINVSGHRFGTAEIEDAINKNEYAIESAVVGFPHDIKGQGIYVFVVVNTKETDENLIKSSIIDSIADHIGKIAKPDIIQVVKGLPKTRSGKIMRRILRKIAEGEKDNFGDISTLLDPNVVQCILETR